MFSLRSILLAVAAFATVASAVPMPAAQDSVTDPSSLIDLITGAGGSPANGVSGILPGSAMGRRGDLQPPSTAYDSFKKCSDGIVVIVVKIKAAIYCDGGPSKVDHDVVTGLLKEILELLVTLLAELRLVDYHGCDVGILSGLIAGLLILVAEILYLVVEVVGTVDKVLCGVVGDIGGLLCEILKLVFGLVEGLLAAVVVILVAPFADHCHGAGLLNVLVLLGIKV